MAIKVDVNDNLSIKNAMDKVLENWGRIDVLVNAAGGHVPGAVIPSDKSVFETSLEDIKKVMGLKLFGTVLSTMMIGKIMADQGFGSIINISSLASSQSITRVLGYSMAKAAIDYLLN